MKRAFLCIISLLPCAARADVARPKKEYPIEDLMQSTTVRGPSFSADGKSLLYTSDESGVFNVYTAPISGGKGRALTTSKDATYAVATFPKDDRFLYTIDPGGSERTHLFVRQVNGQD